MNPTAADYEQAIDEYRTEVSTQHANAILNRAKQLAAARQTDSVEKVIAADWRVANLRGCIATVVDYLGSARAGTFNKDQALEIAEGYAKEARSLFHDIWREK